MQITLAGEYAIRAMLLLATKPFGTIFQTAAIAEEGDIPKPFLRKILSTLTKAGLIESIRGIKGGIRLLKSAQEISLLQIVEVIDGKIFFNKCFFEPNFCHRTNWCAVHAVWSEAQTEVRRILSQKSLEDLVNLNKLNICKVNNSQISKTN